MVKNRPVMQEWRGNGNPTPVFLPGEFHGQVSLVGYSPWGCKELDTIEQLTLSLSPIYTVSQTDLINYSIISLGFLI